MKLFKLSATVTISIYTTVEAETLEEAIQISQDRTIEATPLWNSEEAAMESWLSSEYDGSPQNITQD